MFIASHYTRDIQRFATSHYLYTGVRITVGIMIPTLVLAYWDLLTAAISFVWGALFVSLADQPGPIHHRRNGLLTSTALNAATLLVTGLCQSVPALLWIEIAALSFLFSLAGIYGNRASSIGVLALVVMVLNVTPGDHTYTIWINTALMAAGGLWYTGLSLIAYRVRPYLLVQQAMGEYLNALADYVKAKSDFYDATKVDEDHYNRLMLEQVDVQQVQQQVRDLLFKTREFVTDAAPKGRSLMLMFIESVDLYEQTMSSYEDYKELHRTLKGTGTMERMHQVIVDMGDYMEMVALAVQRRRPPTTWR
ncbi:MAG: hypothetical protein HC859_07980 [Bacteroidia bacterium]|nr:hypothetical protein [Bacteroidia bacterium]